MKKVNRELIFNKYGGKCAYCGCNLVKGWHIDHLDPIRRNLKAVGCIHPGKDCIENMMPSCASCNINKHSESLEIFRTRIAGFMKHLNQISTQYKIAKRYGLIEENIKPVVFFFEKL